MHPYSRKLFVADTDFTGFLYFTRLQDIGLECFIDNIDARGAHAKALLFESDTLFPIVHAEADYKKGAGVGDHLQCHLHLSHVGNTSFSYKVEIYTAEMQEVGCVSIVHVCVDRKRGDKIPIPEEFREVLASINTLEVEESRS